MVLTPKSPRFMGDQQYCFKDFVFEAKALKAKAKDLQKKQGQEIVKTNTKDIQKLLPQ